VEFQPGAKEQLVTMDIEAIAEDIVDMMPDDVRASFRDISQQLLTAFATVTKVRSDLERNEGSTAHMICEEHDDTGAIKEILKRSVVKASDEVARIHKCHVSWRRNTEDRLARLSRAAEAAEKASQQHMAVEAQLSSLKGTQSSKARQVLLRMASGQSSASLNAIFSGWFGVAQASRGEREIREKFEKRLEDVERRLFQFQERRMQSVRAIMLGQFLQDDVVLLRRAVQLWQQEVEERKLEGDTAKKLKEVQTRLAQMQEARTHNAKQVLVRMSAGSDVGLLTLCLQAWLQFSEEYKRNKQSEDALKLMESKLKRQLKHKQQDSRHFLNQLATTSNTGLLGTVLASWKLTLQEEHRAKEMNRVLSETNNKLLGLSNKQSGTANRVQRRINNHLNSNLALQVLGSWHFCVQVARTQHNLDTKLES